MTTEFPMVLIPSPGEGNYIHIVRMGPLTWEIVDKKTYEVLARWERRNIYSEPVCIWRKEEMTIENEATFKYYSYLHHYDGTPIGITEGHYKIEPVGDGWKLTVKMVRNEITERFDTEEEAKEKIKLFLSGEEKELARVLGYEEEAGK